MFKLKNNPVLTSYQIAILKSFFSSAIGKQFFLTGGTALSAFYLGHRESRDLDFFTLEKFDSWKLNRIIDQIRLGLSVEVKTKVQTPDYEEIYLENKKEKWTHLNFMEIFTKTKKKDFGLHEFYFANLVADVRKITNFPPTIKPFKREDLFKFYLELSKKLFEKIRPE